MKFFSARDELSLDSPSYRRHVLHFLYELLEQDIGEKGDITTESLEIAGVPIVANIMVKEPGILAGMEELGFFLENNRKKIARGATFEFSCFRNDGQAIKAGERILELRGNAGPILKLERTLLNFLQRMSGIATLTASYVRKVPSNVLIVPTRKTPWGILDKKACLAGGGGTHRLHLSDAILLKDTHLKILKNDFAKIFQKLSRRHRNFSPKFIEIEVETRKQAFEALQAYLELRAHGRKNSFFGSIPFVLMFDNIKPAVLRKLLRDLERKFGKMPVLFEASGGIRPSNVLAYAKSGVHILSIGSLTHSASALDFSLKVF